MEADAARAVQLLVAAQTGDVERIRALLPPCGYPAGESAAIRAAAGGVTLLMAAAAGGHHAMVELLLRRGADPARRVGAASQRGLLRPRRGPPVPGGAARHRGGRGAGADGHQLGPSLAGRVPRGAALAFPGAPWWRASWRFGAAGPACLPTRPLPDRSGWVCGVVRPGMLIRIGILRALWSSSTNGPYHCGSDFSSAVALTCRLACPAVSSVRRAPRPERGEGAVRNPAKAGRSVCGASPTDAAGSATNHFMTECSVCIPIGAAPVPAPLRRGGRPAPCRAAPARPRASVSQRGAYVGCEQAIGG